MDAFTVAWVTWLAAFLAIEAVALARRDSGDTLSEHLRTWLGTDRKASTRHRVVGAGAFLLFCLWFVPHILLG